MTEGYSDMSSFAERSVSLDDEHDFGVPLAAEKVARRTAARHRNPPIHRDAQVADWSMLGARVRGVARRERHDTAYFFRHGATNYNERGLVTGQHDTELTEGGRRQARSLRIDMPDKVDLIVCSNLRRAVQTMSLGVPKNVQAHAHIRIDRRFNEVNLGELQGRRRRHLEPYASGDLDYAPLGGESYRDAGRRVFSGVVDIFDHLYARDSDPGVAVVFCHAGVLRIVSTLLGQHHSSKDVFNSSFKNAECLAISANRLRLPAFWSGGTNEKRAHRRN